MRHRRLATIGLFALAGHLACTPTPDTGVAAKPSSAKARLQSPSGLFQNGLTSNGLFQNGLFQNGLFQNGLFQNGLFQNGLFQNSLTLDALWHHETWAHNPAALTMLRANPYARDVLKYVYECAMPATASAVLDPDGEQPLELQGLIGLARPPEPSRPEDACDEGCRQRWVTACVLARTNAYGAPVAISMRVPDDAPRYIREALAVTDADAPYSLPEGAFYGNMFRHVPRASEGEALTMMAPAFYACAGPGSNIPQVTKRFCSSQGAGGPIRVPGTCEHRADFPYGACAEKDGATGALKRCYTSVDSTEPRTEYKEVITVYLQKPIEVCGNSVCEQEEARTTYAAGAGGAAGAAGGAAGAAGAAGAGGGAAGAAGCPSDCHPGGWAQSFRGLLSTDLFEYYNGDGDYPNVETAWAKTSAVGPDDTVALAGLAASAIDLGGGDLDGGDPEESTLYGALAKYGPDGDYRWGVRFGTFHGASTPGSVVVTKNRSIGVLVTDQAWSWDDAEPYMWLGKADPDSGIFEWEGGLFWGGPHKGIALTADPNNNFIAAGIYYFGLIGGDASLPQAASGQTTFVTKVSPDQQVLWVTDVGPASVSQPTAIAADEDGNVLLTLQSDTLEAGLWKLSGETGEVLWTRRGWHHGVAAGPNRAVYATGMLAPASGKPENYTPGTYDFDAPTTARGGDFFIVEYDGDTGEHRRHTVITPDCHDDDPPCGGRFDGRDMSVDPAGNVVVAVFGGNGDTINFGAGSFPTYATDDVFVAAFSPALTPRWAKHVPLVLDGAMRGMQLDGRGRAVMSGTFGGSMLFDDRLLVSNIPEQRGVGNTFLAAFSLPSLSDVTAPAADNVPLDLRVEATSLNGAEVFFMPPTALDGGHAGVSVACSPPPSTVFAIGSHEVTCTATDPLGNPSSRSFIVEVVDSLGPALLQVPAPIAVGLDGPQGAVVTFDPPVAFDLVDGQRDVTCLPASGSLFPPGPTTVTCSTADAEGRLTEASFQVMVGTPTAQPPTFTGVPTSFSVEAAGPAGATAAFALPSAVDANGVAVPVACAPASGSTFPLGATTVVCSASDAQGNQAQASFNVSVVDTTPPALIVPAPINATATSAQGALVTYAASATDGVSGALAPTCSWPAGSLFPLGTTEVTCWASDASGNTTELSFPVTVTFAWSGLLKPLDNDEEVFQIGTRLKARFRLTGASAGITDANATLTAVETEAPPEDPKPRVRPAPAPNRAMVFRYNPTKGWYECDVPTRSMAAGHWKLRVELGDGVERSVHIELW